MESTYTIFQVKKPSLLKDYHHDTKIITTNGYL